MKKLKLIIPVVLFFIFAIAACNNEGSDTNKSTKDTVAQKDTISSDPSQFSDPH